MNTLDPRVPGATKGLPRSLRRGRAPRTRTLGRELTGPASVPGVRVRVTAPAARWS